MFSIFERESKPLSKMEFMDCSSLFKDKTEEELPLFDEIFFDKPYYVTIRRVDNETFIIRVNCEDFIWINKKQVGLMFYNDPYNQHTTFKVNLANLFMFNDYRLAFSNCDAVSLVKKDGTRESINKMLILQKDDGYLHIE